MARRKKAKSLFEVITHPPRPTAVPPAVSGQQDRPAAGPGAFRAEAAPKASGRPAVTLSQFHVVSFGVGVVLLVVLAFLWGRSVGIRAAGRAAGGVSPLGPGFINGKGADTGLPPMVKDDFQRTRGYLYWVIHENVASYRDGLEIKRFFHRNGVGVTVNPDPSLPTQYVIKDTRGFPPTGSPRSNPDVVARQELLSKLCELYMTQSRAGLIPGRPYDFKKLSLETER